MNDENRGDAQAAVGDLCAIAAYEIADTTPKIQVERGDLRNGRAIAISAAQLYRLGKWFDTGTNENELGILKQVAAAMALKTVSTRLRTVQYARG